MSRRRAELVMLTIAFLIALSGCMTSEQEVSRRPAAPDTAIAMLSLPDGWYTAPTPGGRIFANTSGFRSLVTSPANPSEIAGCGLPPLGGDQKSMPEFLWSMDAGHSWQTHAITGASPTTFCAIVADTMLPQTFVLQTGIDWTNQLLMTRDNGATWQPLTIPSDYTVSLYGAPGYTMPAMVNGHLIAGFLPSGQTEDFHLNDLTLSGRFVPLDAHMPQPPKISGLPDNTLPEAFAVDPSDPRHFYAAVYGAFGPNHTSGFRLYETRDAGATWKYRHEWPTSLRLGIWTTPDDTVYVVDYQDAQPGIYFLLGGLAWRYTAVNSPGFFVGPSGKVLVFTSQGNTQSMFLFDATRQRLTSLGQAPSDLSSLTVAVIVDYPSPTLLVATSQGTFGLPLTTAS